MNGLFIAIMIQPKNFYGLKVSLLVPKLSLYMYLKNDKTLKKSIKLKMRSD